MSVRVGRGLAPEIPARLLRDLPVADLTIEDPPIEYVIESVFAQGQEAADSQAIAASV